jgi:MFS family permease
LRANGPFRLLWTSRAISLSGSSLSLVALVLFTADHTGAGVAVALLMLIYDLLPALLSPFTGLVADRFDLRRVLVGCELGQALLFAGLAFALASLPLMLVLVAGAAVLSHIFEPASRAAVPVLVRDYELPTANAAIGLGVHGFDLIGPLLAGALLPAVGFHGVFLLDASTFVVSAVLLQGLPRTPKAVLPTSDAASLLADARAGIRVLWRSPLLRLIFWSFCAVVAFTAVDDVALVFLARGPLHGSQSAASVLYAGAALGLPLGLATLSRARLRVVGPLMLVVGYAISSIGNLLTGLAGALAVAFAFQVIRGLGLAVIDTAVPTLIQRDVPKDLLGRAFSNVYGAVGLAAGVSYVLGGLLISHAGPRVTLVVAGSGGLVISLVAAIVAADIVRRRRQTA